MNKQDKDKDKQIKQEEEYLEFLKKRINSENYKTNVTKDEFDKTKNKYEKAKFKLRILKGL